MNPDLDIDLNGVESTALNMSFWTRLQNFPGLTKAAKGSMMRMFEGLTPTQKRELLEGIDRQGDNFQKARYANRFFEEVDFNQDDDWKAMSSDEVRRAVVEQARTAATNPRRVSSTSIKPTKPKKREYEAMKALNNLTGLEKVKRQVRELIAFVEMGKLREQHGLKFQKQTLHMMFKGNPGTGKTTVARLLGRIFQEIGVLERGHVIELDRSNLISKYQGEIERKIMEYVQQAEGGILFIDEVYSMIKQGDNNDQGRQGVEVLLKAIEDKGHNFICIGAGYSLEVDEFLGSNPGLPSRFPIQIEFEDYTEDELLSIATSMLNDRDYKMDESFKTEFNKTIKEEKTSEKFGNGRVVRNIVESAIREQSLRLFDSEVELSKDDLMTVKGADFKYEPLKLKTRDDEDDDGPSFKDFLKYMKDKSETA